MPVGGSSWNLDEDDGQGQELDWPEEKWNDWTDVAGDFAEEEPYEWGASDAECRCGGFGGCICEEDVLVSGRQPQNLLSSGSSRTEPQDGIS